MLNIKTLVSVLVITVTSTTACQNCSPVIRNYYEEKVSYSRNPQCKPSLLDKGIKCSNIGKTIEVQGGLVSTTISHFRIFCNLFMQ